MAGLRTNSPDHDDLDHSTLDIHEIGGGQRRGLPMSHSSLDEDDPNILLAIQLSLQESASVAIDAREILTREASLGAIGTSLPSLQDPSQCGVDVPRTALSSSKLFEVGDSLKISGQNAPVQLDKFSNTPREDGEGSFHGPTGASEFSSDDANLLGNIMAWFHDMNPQNISLIPTAGVVQQEPVCMASEVHELPLTQWSDRNEEREYHPETSAEEQELVRPTQLDLVRHDVSPLSALSVELGERLSALNPETPKCDSDPDQPSSSSSEWEGQVHLV
ncbi:hypothetical protein DNTS_003396 [Danionella cerebrum]|uniref:Uncharacterized protein n=1 Tax=Danionella cerebrum TaxID=2873325 RepID=A0A553RQ70_9TELE|nr:hypothetical protein DNTS_003396 [Danionella translucida]